MDLDVDVQEVEETVTVRVLARVGMRRSHEGGYRIEVEMAVCLGRRGIRPKGEARGAIVELQFDGIRPIDSRLVNRPSGEGDPNRSRPDGEKHRGEGEQGERGIRRVQERTHAVIRDRKSGGKGKRVDA